MRGGPVWAAGILRVLLCERGRPRKGARWKGHAPFRPTLDVSAHVSESANLASQHLSIRRQHSISIFTASRDESFIVLENDRGPTADEFLFPVVFISRQFPPRTNFLSAHNRVGD